MCLGIRQAQGCTPGHAQHHPPIDPEMFAQTFHIGDQVRRGVAGQVCIRLAGQRSAPAGPTLVEQCRLEHTWIEESTLIRRAPRPRSAVEKHRRCARGIATCLPVHRVSVADAQHAGVVGFDRWE